MCVCVWGGVLGITLFSGRYTLQLKELKSPDHQNDITIEIAKGELVMGDYVMEQARVVQLRTAQDATGLQVAAVTTYSGTSSGGACVDIHLVHHTSVARVHLISAHFVPEYSAMTEFGRLYAAVPGTSTIARVPSLYNKERDLGDEAQYILDRKLAKKYVGNMLPKPSLLLNER